MSVTTRRTKSSTPSSILKKSVTYKNKLNNSNASPKVHFMLPHSEKVRSILRRYAIKENTREYENLVCLIRDGNLSDKEVSSLLKEATECIYLLNQDLRLFVEALLLVKWTGRSDVVVKEYQSFLVNLISAHNYHSRIVIEALVSCFLPGILFQIVM